MEFIPPIMVIGQGGGGLWRLGRWTMEVGGASIGRRWWPATMGGGWRQKAAQNREKQSNPRGRRAGAGELKVTTASPVARMGGGRRLPVGSGAMSERERMREEGEEEKQKVKGGSHGQAGEILHL